MSRKVLILGTFVVPVVVQLLTINKDGQTALVNPPVVISAVSNHESPHKDYSSYQELNVDSTFTAEVSPSPPEDFM